MFLLFLENGMNQMNNNQKIYLIRYVGDHPIAIEHPEKCYEIRKLENLVVIKVNKLAKEADGEGPQLHLEVGERITLSQATQIERTYSVVVTPVYSEEDNIEMLLD